MIARVALTLRRNTVLAVLARRQVELARHGSWEHSRSGHRTAGLCESSPPVKGTTACRGTPGTMRRRGRWPSPTAFGTRQPPKSAIWMNRFRHWWGIPDHCHRCFRADEFADKARDLSTHCSYAPQAITHVDQDAPGELGKFKRSLMARPQASERCQERYVEQVGIAKLAVSGSQRK
jgi:hypothetical protein